MADPNLVIGTALLVLGRNWGVAVAAVPSWRVTGGVIVPEKTMTGGELPLTVAAEKNGVGSLPYLSRGSLYFCQSII